MKDYSQFGEQAAIIEACVGTADDGLVGPPGRFLDLGAYDPFKFSNTRALFELGWTGTMVEPEPRALLRLMAEYGAPLQKVRIISAAVGLEPGMVDLYATEDATATTSESHFDTWKGACKYDALITVPCITLEQISNWYGGFDMVNIDVEGYSADLCIKMLALGWEPRCFVVEHDNRMTEICQRASERGYKMLMANGTNGVFGK